MNLPRVAAIVALMIPTAGIDAQQMTRQEFDALFAEVSNAGRWGREDSLGTLNLLTPAVRAAAARAVRTGITISLARPLATGPNPNALIPLAVQFITAPAGDTRWFVDVPTLPMHGWAFSHLDALAHAAFRGALYNGVSGMQVDTVRGASRLGITAIRNGIVGRGVLIDLGWLRGRAWLDSGDVVTIEDFEAWERRTGVELQAGDIILVRTGRGAREREFPGWRIAAGASGLHPTVARWLRAMDVAALGGDGAHDAYPSPVVGVAEPLHQLALVSMGMPLLDNLALEELARHATAQRQWTFLLVVAPLPVAGGSGSMVNALAIF